jgi:hypothetical protein
VSNGVISSKAHASCAPFAPRGPSGSGSPDSQLLRSALTSRRPLACSLPRAAVPPDVGVVEISQLSGKPTAYVPCSMTPVESASRPMLPPAFPDGVGLHEFLYGAQSHGPTRSLSTLRLRVAPSPQDSLPAVPSALAGRAWLPAGFQLEVSAHGSILLNQTWLAHQGDREIRSRASF